MGLKWGLNGVKMGFKRGLNGVTTGLKWGYNRVKTGVKITGHGCPIHVVHALPVALDGGVLHQSSHLKRGENGVQTGFKWG